MLNETDEVVVAGTVAFGVSLNLEGGVLIVIAGHSTVILKAFDVPIMVEF